MPPGRWFALADQQLAPTIAVIRLLGTTKPFRIQRFQSRGMEFDGMVLKGLTDVGAAMLGRIGIVRGQSSLAA